MNRREMIGAAGAAGAGLALGGRAAAAGHGQPANGKAFAPVGNHHLHFCGFHMAKKDPELQFTAQHYCGLRGDGEFEMHQCLLYHGVGKDAKLLGVEYIISDGAFWKLPHDEKKYWHPHTYEVLGGGLIAPSMTPADELAFMKGLLTTWGKAWHTWPDPDTPIPMGEPLLMWSLMADGQEDEDLVAARDKEFGVSTAEVRRKRVEAIGLEVPNVPVPRSVDAIGRQWTAAGDDKPTQRK